LIQNTLETKGVMESFSVERDDTYNAQDQVILDVNVKGLCILGEAMENLLTIEAAERAMQSYIWIER